MNAKALARIMENSKAMREQTRKYLYPICHESRDLGYARERMSARRRFVWLSVVLVGLLWVLWEVAR